MANGDDPGGITLAGAHTHRWAILSAVAFLMEGDRMYGALALIVLAALLFSFVESEAF